MNIFLQKKFSFLNSPTRQGGITMKKLQVVVTNPKTKEEYNQMIDKINEEIKEMYSNIKKDLYVRHYI